MINFILLALIFFIAKKILDKTFEDKREKIIKRKDYGNGNLRAYGFEKADKSPIVKRRLKNEKIL